MSFRRYRYRTAIKQTPDKLLIIEKLGGRMITFVMTVGLVLVSVAALVMPVKSTADAEMQRMVLLLIGVPVTAICAGFIYRMWAYYATLFEPASGRIGSQTVFGSNHFCRRLGRVVNFECQEGDANHDMGYSVYAVCEFGVKPVGDEIHLDAAKALCRQLNDHVLLYEDLRPTIRYANLELESRQLATLRYLVAGGMMAIVLYVLLIVLILH